MNRTTESRRPANPLAVLDRPDPRERLIVSLWELHEACANVLRAHAGECDSEPCAYCENATHLPYVMFRACEYLAECGGDDDVDLVALEKEWMRLRGEEVCPHLDNFTLVAPARPNPSGPPDDDEADEPAVIPSVA
jgi:hypothetical protein